MAGDEKSRTAKPDRPGAHHETIAEQMRRMFENFAQEPIPDDIQKLAARLEEKLRQSEPNGEPPHGKDGTE